MNAPLPPNENERLAVLWRYAILDTPNDPAFDRITALAARLLNAPIAQVTLVDEKRQWFKSSFGTPVGETSRDVSFCAHAILADAVMVVRDASADPRFKDNPLVAGETGIRFYAGAPLQVGGAFNLGTLCIVDTVSRDFSETEQRLLAELAAIAADELELRIANRENRRLATAISNLSSGVVVTDPSLPDSPIIFANPGFGAITGYQPEEFLGRNCRFLQGPDTDPAMLEKLREAIRNRRPFQGTLLNYRKDGTSFYNELTVSPVLDQEGRLTSFVGLQNDVSDRHKLEGLRDSLIHMVVHDLRTPLTTIMGFLDVLEAQAAAKLNPEEAGFINICQKAAETLNEMVTMLLDVNRLEAGEMPLNVENCDLCELAATVTAGPRALVGENKLALDLPATPVMAACDRTVIGRVLTNLVGNALKFIPQKGGAVRVSVTTDDAFAQVSVADNGPGVPKEYHRKIFEKFGQVESERKRHSTGLGLTFCKLAIDAHHGTISVQSELGKGSTFSFTLPIRPL